MEKIKWPEKVNNEQLLVHIGEKRTPLNNTLRRKTNWIGHIMGRNYLHQDSIEEQMTEAKIGRRRRGRITQFIDDLSNRRRY